MDPLRDMMLNSGQFQPANSNISVEEGMDCREVNSRFFSMLNQDTRLNIIISKASTIVSCKLDGHEIVVDERLYDQLHETWSISDRPFQKINLLPWNCHVRGAELILSVPNGTSTMFYELTPVNELNNIVKLKSIYLQQPVFYFNLNNAKEKSSIDGHSLVVQCNGNMNRIQVQNTKLLCQCNKKALIMPRSLIGDIPHQLTTYSQVNLSTINSSTSNNSNSSNPNQAPGTEDDQILCDAIYGLESTCPLDVLKVELRFRNRALVLETRSNNKPPPNNPSSTSSSINQQTGVTSSTTTNKADSEANWIRSTKYQSPTAQREISTSNLSISGSHDSHFGNQDHSNKRRWSSASNTLTVDSSSHISNAQQVASSNVSICVQANESITTSSPTNSFSKPTSSTATQQLAQPSTILRARVRVTNFGVAIMPIMMTSYSSTYRFAWWMLKIKVRVGSMFNLIDKIVC